MSSVNLGRVAFVYRGDFVPGKEYCRYDIVAAHGNLYHCMGLEMYAYNKIDVDEAGNVIGLDANWWELFLKGTGGYALKAGAGIEVEKDDLGNWTIKNIATVTGGNNIDVKTTTSGNTVTYKVTGLHQPITSSTLKIKHYTDIDEKTKVKVDGYEVDWPLGKTEGIDVKQSSDGKWNFTAKTSKVNVATWEKWWIKYPWDINDAIPEEIIPMPDYFNSASIDIVGLFNQYPVSGNSQQNPLVGQTIPVFNYRARYRVGTNSADTAYSATKDESKDTYVNSPAWTSRDNYINNPDKPAGYNIWKFEESNLISETNYPGSWGCFFVYSQDDKGYYPGQALYNAPYNEGQGTTSNTSNPYTAILSGPNNDTLAFFKISSDSILDYPTKTSNKCWHWHVYCRPNGLQATEDNYRLELPGCPTYNQIYERVRDAQGKASYKLVSSNKDLEFDKWYSFVWYPVSTTQAKPIVVELDADDMNYIQQSSVVNRYCSKQGDIYKFSIETPDGTKNFEIPESGDKAFNKYFTIKYESDGTTIKEVELTDKSTLITDYSDACLYTPSSGSVCNIIDKDLKNKRLFTQVCIPEFSGCTFIKNQ